MMGGFGMGVGGFLWIILLGVAIWAIVSATNSTRARSATGSVRDVLDARLARGELSVEEYKKLRETLV